MQKRSATNSRRIQKRIDGSSKAVSDRKVEICRWQKYSKRMAYFTPNFSRIPRWIFFVLDLMRATCHSSHSRLNLWIAVSVTLIFFFSFLIFHLVFILSFFLLDYRFIFFKIFIIYYTWYLDTRRKELSMPIIIFYIFSIFIKHI